MNAPLACEMTTRMWLTGQVLAGISTDPRYNQQGSERASAADIARFATIIADAVIELQAAQPPAPDARTK